MTRKKYTGYDIDNNVLIQLMYPQIEWLKVREKKNGKLSWLDWEWFYLCMRVKLWLQKLRQQ